MLRWSQRFWPIPTFAISLRKIPSCWLSGAVPLKIPEIFRCNYHHVMYVLSDAIFHSLNQCFFLAVATIDGTKPLLLLQNNLWPQRILWFYGVRRAATVAWWACGRAWRAQLAATKPSSVTSMGPYQWKNRTSGRGGQHEDPSGKCLENPMHSIRIIDVRRSEHRLFRRFFGHSGLNFQEIPQEQNESWLIVVNNN